ncbi:hydrogen gas-evolving membrane-bound hydrogenase subunit E [Legionella nagasakiensis]|uniref:hydrogen gas-evolving membrane-bound hydrogenase subunit E n=1 Tax=Legionella nagasakiensis TaxID=535290 RepID=UPI001F5E9AA3|nr:hydrogen gas-evolving membrane-bound hydrogenase subunit E [Legionella nagasakiensis]
MMIASLLLLPLLAAFLSPVIAHKIHNNSLGWFLALIPFLMFFITLMNSKHLINGEIAYLQISWFDALNIHFSFCLDGLSQLFLLLISGIGVPITIYSKPYFEENPYLGRYYFLLFMFMMSMTGAVLADDMITLFIFWEITTVCSFLLIGLNHAKRTARKSAIEALFITVLGGSCLLTAFILINQLTGMHQISALIKDVALINNSSYFPWILILFLIAVFTKSAQFPFSFWLPGAMKAPTPVSAYLHSATMVQLGIYLLGRFHPLFGETFLWFVSLTTIGGITMLTSALAAFKQFDMKLMLAYTTVIALGSLVFLLASTYEVTIKAAVSFLLVHGLYKATLFMAVGDIQHQTGTRHLKKLGGLHRAMPVTFLAVLIASASMAGLPPLLGFYVKELVYEASLSAPMAAYILSFIVVMANMMMAATAFILIINPFWGKQYPLNVKEANVNMSVNALLVAIITLFLSIFTETLDRFVLSPAAETILGRRESIVLAPAGTGLTPSLLLSVLTLTGAILLYFNRHSLRERLIKLNILRWLIPQKALQFLLNMSVKTAQGWTSWWQKGSLSQYISIIFLTICLTIFIYPLSLQWNFNPGRTEFLFIVIILWLILSAIALLFVRKFINGLIALSAFGLGLAFFFIVQGAPDLAMTQALVETLMVILIVFSLSGLTQWPDIEHETNRQRWLKGGIAIIFGLFITLILNVILREPFNNTVGRYFMNNSLPVGHGRNVVNVILVDFRALDTLGETIVILIAAIGILLLQRYHSGESR